MTKDDFLHELEFELGFLPRFEVNEAKKYYSALFVNFKNDEELPPGTGTPKEAAEKFYAERFKENHQPENNTYNNETPSRSKFPWWIFALIILLPILLPCVLCILIFAALIVSIPFLLSVCIFMGGIGMIWSSIFSSVNVYTSLVQAGIGCIMLSVGLILVCAGVMILVKAGIWLIKSIANFGNRQLHKSVNKH